MADWKRVAAASEIVEGAPLLVVVDSDDIALFRVKNDIFATDDLCTHAEASLVEGDQEGYIITCPRHGGQFDIRNGAPKHFPVFSPIRTYPVRIEGDDVYIEV